MTDAERIDRLEQLLLKLVWALARKDTEANGNWGYPSYGAILTDIVGELPAPPVNR